MKTISKFVLVAALAAFLAGFPVGPAGAAQLEWHPYLQGMELGKVQQKKIFIFFYADWCGYCHKMEEETFADPETSSYLKQNFVLIKVNSDKAKDLASEYSVKGLPTSWFISPAGKKITRMPGYRPPEFFLPALKFINTEAYKKMSFKEFLSQKSNEKPM